MSVLKCFVVSACLASVVSFAQQPGPAAALRAGAARVSITPTADEFPYVIGREKPFVGVHNDVYARALVLESGGTRVAILSVEVESIPDPPQMVKEVAKAVGAPPAHVLLIATHTHESLTVFIHGTTLLPVQTEEIEHVRRGMVEAARTAAAHLEPATIAFGQGAAYININNGEQAGIRNWFDPTGPSDKTLDVIRVQTAAGAPLALVASYATHAETMYRSVTRDGGYEVSGDVPGAAARMVETNPAGAPVALFLPGAEADQLTIFKSVQPADGNKPAADEGAGGWALVDVQARRLLSSVLDVLTAMPAGRVNVSIEVGTGGATCPGGRIRTDFQTGQITRQDGPPVTIPVTTVQIGDMAIAAVGADIASAYGNLIRTASPVPHTMVISMLAGAVGYVLTDASYAHPGHGLGGSPIKQGCAETALPSAVAETIKTADR